MLAYAFLLFLVMCITCIHTYMTTMLGTVRLLPASRDHGSYDVAATVTYSLGAVLHPGREGGVSPLDGVGHPHPARRLQHGAPHAPGTRRQGRNATYCHYSCRKRDSRAKATRYCFKVHIQTAVFLLSVACLDRRLRQSPHTIFCRPCFVVAVDM